MSLVRLMLIAAATQSVLGARKHRSSVQASCMEADYAVMDSMGFTNSDSSFPGQMSACAKAAVSWLGGWNSTKFMTCATDKGLSQNCSLCFEDGGEYGFNNCKIKCARRWCHTGCLECLDPNHNKLQSCVGRNL